MKTFLIISLFVLLVFSTLQAQVDSTKTYTWDELFNMSMEEILQVKVSIATQNEQSLENVPSIVTVISSAEMRAMGARDIRDVLRTVPGFQLGYNWLGYNQLAVRGVMTNNTEKIKMLVDGISVNEHLEGSGMIAFGDMNIENVERIEIIRGPGSALYGTSAFVGVINIITKKTNGIDAVVQSGSFNTINASVCAGKRIDNLNISTFFSYLNTDGAKEKIEQDALTNDPLNKDISLAGTDKGVTDYKRNEIRGSLGLEYKKLYFKSYLSSAKKGWFGGNGTTGNVTANSEAKPVDMCGVLGYKFRLAENVTLEPRLYSNYYKADNLWNDHPDGYRVQNTDGTITTYTKGSYVLNGATQRTLGGDLKLSYKVFTNNLLVLGTSYENMKLYDLVDKTSVSNPTMGKQGLVNMSHIMKDQVKRNVFSAFAQDQWDLLDNLILTGGVRWDKYSDAGNTVNPRAALVYKPIPKLATKLMYGQAFRAPTFVESYLYVANGFVVGKENNKPEKIQTYEAEVSYQLSKNLYFRINYYYNYIDNLINMNSILEDGKLVRLEYANSNAKTTVQGLESELRFTLAGKFTGFANYSYNKGESKTGEIKERLTGVAPHVVNVGGNLLLNKYLNINATLTCIGKREQAKTDTREVLKGYNYGMLCLTGKNFVKNLEISLSAYNVLNSDVRYFDQNNIFKNHYPVEKINVLLGLRYTIH